MTIGLTSLEKFLCLRPTLSLSTSVNTSNGGDQELHTKKNGKIFNIDKKLKNGNLNIILSFLQIIPKTILNAALTSKWRGSSEALQHTYPNYDGIVLQIRQKIIRGIITIKNDQWIDTEEDFEPINCANTYVCCLKFWRRLTDEERTFIKSLRPLFHRI
jgi:hypothetical protein